MAVKNMFKKKTIGVKTASVNLMPAHATAH